MSSRRVALFSDHENTPPPARLSDAWRDVRRLTRFRPGLLLPFTLLAAAELCALFLFLNPPHSFADWLNPFIARRFGAEHILFPQKVAVLPSLMWGTRVVLEIVVGGLFSAWVTSRVLFLVRRESKGFWGALGVVLPRLISFGVLSGLMVLLGRVAATGTAALFALKRDGAPVFPPPYGPYLFLAASILAVTLIGALFAFTLPAMVGRRLPLLSAMGFSVRRFGSRPGQAIALVAVPGVPYLLLSAAISFAPVLFGFAAPEGVVALMAAAVLAAAVARYLMVAGAAALYAHEEPDQPALPRHLGLSPDAEPGISPLRRL